jgi:hypothetical protein
MNRILRNDGTWYKRNGPNGTGIAWFFDISGGVTDPLLLNSVIQFTYTPAGGVPADSYEESLNLDSDIVNFSYTP